MEREALRNLEALRDNPYPGRILVVGGDPSGEYLIQVYGLMGRSQGSRNRLMEYDESTRRVYTTAADPQQVADPSLIIYNAMRESVGAHVVTNGHQTDTIIQSLDAGGSFFEGLNTWQYEPDSPIYTPRISAACYARSRMMTGEIAILRKCAKHECDRRLYRYGCLPRGFGYCATTYDSDGDPPPAFSQDPYPLPLGGEIREVAESIWAALNPKNRVSLAVKFIQKNPCAHKPNSSLHIINQYIKAQ